MNWFRKRSGRKGPAGSDGARPDPVEQFLDPYHPRASVREGDLITIDPGKVLENIQHALERLDLDINTPISIEEDVVTLDELLFMIDVLRMGPSVHVHVVNHAMSIMSRRYPADLVTRPLPPEFDLRVLTPIEIGDDLHDIAVLIFNMRAIQEEDIVEGDVGGLLAGLDGADQATTFTALFYACGLRLGALKSRTGID